MEHLLVKRIVQPTRSYFSQICADGSSAIDDGTNYWCPVSSSSSSIHLSFAQKHLFLFASANTYTPIIRSESSQNRPSRSRVTGLMRNILHVGTSCSISRRQLSSITLLGNRPTLSLTTDRVVRSPSEENWASSQHRRLTSSLFIVVVCGRGDQTLWDDDYLYVEMPDNEHRC